MTLQNTSLNSLLKDNSNSGSLLRFFVKATLFLVWESFAISGLFWVYFFWRKACAKCFLPRPFSIVIHFELINISQKMNRAGCHSYFSPRLEIMTMIGQNLMVVNGLLEWKRKVGTKRSWLDIMSWLDMHWYRGGKRDESYLAMSLDTLVIILVHWVQKFWYWGGFVAIKTNFCFECHVWTSAKNNTPWKRWEKCLWAWPLCW